MAIPRAEAQETPPKHVLAPGLSVGATATHVTDLTGDGRQDLVSGSSSDGSLVWRENVGGGSLSEPRTIDTGLGKVESVHAADLNGDGDADVVATDSTSGRVVWYKQEAGGSFSSANVITGDVQSPHSVYAADLTGNGRIDVLSASEDDGKIAWYENTGGAFSSQKVITGAASEARSVRAADVDGDGDLDVLAGSGNEIAWHENTGGTFGGRTVLNSSANGIQSVRAADLTGNEDLDILAGITGILGAGKVIWHQNTGGAGFSAEKELASDAGDVQSVAASDLNGDGDLDVISAQIPQDSDQGPQIAWSENLGNGSFSEQTVVSTAASTGVTIGLTLGVADMDGDDDPDILSGFDRSDPGDDGRIGWYRNQLSQPGSINWQQGVLSPQLAKNVRAVRAADLTGDGEKEVLSGSTDPFGGSPHIAWYPSPRAGASTQYLIDTDLQGPESLHAADLDGDGDQDVLAITNPPTTSTESKVVWYENAGNGAFLDRTVLTTNVEDGTSVYAQDLTGSGAPDVLMASEDDGKVVWHEGEGGGDFSPQKTITTDAAGAQSVEAGDLDGDGDADVLFAAASSDEVAWVENEGDGSFSEKKVITTDAESARSVHAADLTGNGRLDVLSASRGDRKIAWYENQGSGTFSDQEVITTAAHEARSVHAADLTGNGLPDVVSASQQEESSFTTLGSNKVAWYRNEGGSFSSQRVLTTDSDDPESVFAADVGGDESPDVLFAAEGSKEVAWFENTSDALPVEMAGFDATAAAEKIQLTWQTASETNNAGFEVQRRVTGAEGPGASGTEQPRWERVGYVESKASGGSTTETKSYRFADAGLPYEADRLEYRLRQVDTDGSAHFSEEIAVNRGAPELELLGTSPNPARSRATVRYALPEKQEVALTLYDVLGRKVRTVLSRKQEGRNQRTLDVGTLPSGTYFLRLRSNGRVRTQKLTVMR